MAFTPIPENTDPWHEQANAAWTDQDQRITDLEDAAEGGNYFYLVASASAPGGVRAKADYVCDGIADQIEIQAAIDAANAASGGIVQLSTGQFNISAPLTLHPRVTLRGMHGDQIFNPDQLTLLSRLNIVAEFVGGAAIVMLGQTAGGYGGKSAEQRIHALTIDGANGPAGTHGIQASDYVHGVVLRDVAVKQVKGKGIYTFVENAAQPFSWTMNRVVVDNAEGNGIELINHSDFTANDVVVIGSGVNGWLLSSMPNSRLTQCRAEWSEAHGFNIQGNFGTGQGSGGMQVVGCSTDRNGQNGFDITATGNGPIMISDIMLRRDGRNGGAGGGNFSGMLIAGATCPVIVTGLVCYPGVDDTGAGVNSPDNAFRVTGSAYVSLESGFLHGALAGFVDGGTNTVLRRGANIGERTGTTAAPVNVFTNSTVDFSNLSTIGFQPSDHSLKAWSFDPSGSIGGAASTAGVLYAIKVPLRQAETITAIIHNVTTAGATLTAGQNLIGLYNNAGTLVAQTGDQSGNWTSIGTKTANLTTPYVATAGYYFVGFLTNGTTPPQFLRDGSQSASANNLNIRRFVTVTGPLTALPASFDPVGGASTDNNARWAALD